MTDAQFDNLDRFVAYADKQFELGLLAGCFASDRVEPGVPDRAAGLSLLLSEAVHIPSHNHLREKSKLPQWQRWVGYLDPISHDTFGHAANRMNPQQLGRADRFINRNPTLALDPCRSSQAGSGAGPEGDALPCAGRPRRAERGTLVWQKTQVPARPRNPAALAKSMGVCACQGNEGGYS